MVRATKQSLDEAGAYLLENGQTMILFLGRHVIPLLLNDLFGPQFNHLKDLDFQMTILPSLETQISIQLRNTIAYIRETRPARALFIQLARQTMDGAEHEFSSLLVEDRNNEAQAYGEYLPYLHRQINMEVCPLARGLY
jgi:protein transport protein SEC24